MVTSKPQPIRKHQLMYQWRLISPFCLAGCSFCVIAPLKYSISVVALWQGDFDLDKRCPCYLKRRQNLCKYVQQDGVAAIMDQVQGRSPRDRR